MNNVTTQFMPDGLGTASDIILIIGVLAISIGTLSILLYTAQSLEKYQRFKNIFKKIAGTLNYAAYGTLTLVIIATPCYLGYIGLTYTVENPGNVLPLMKWIGIIGGLYIGMTLLGYITKNKIWTKIFKHRKEDKKEKNMEVTT